MARKHGFTQPPEVRAKIGAGRRLTLEERFRAKYVIEPNGCYRWTGCMRPDGYGQVWAFGTVRKAHRVALILAGRELPAYDGGSTNALVVDHICRNTWCVNADHLRIVRQGDNCGVLAKPTPFFTNKLRLFCPKGHPYSGENVARLLTRRGKRGQWGTGRMCLTCWPHYKNHPRRFWLPEDLPADEFKSAISTLPIGVENP